MHNLGNNKKEKTGQGVGGEGAPCFLSQLLLLQGVMGVSSFKATLVIKWRFLSTTHLKKIDLFWTY